MTEEKFLALIQQTPCLYDCHDKYYNDMQKKMQAWKEISQKMNSTIHDCRKQWGNLREALRRHIKKRKILLEGGLPHKGLKKWRYEEEMAFVMPHLKERRRTKYDSDSDVEESGPQQDHEGHDPLLEVAGGSNRTVAEVNEQDSLSAFFLSMAATVRTFPPKDRIDTKVKVFEVISQMEYMVLQKSQNSMQEQCFIDIKEEPL